MRAYLLGVMGLGLAAMLLPQTVWADWDSGMPAKWIQLPDLSPSGIDIRDDQNAGLRRIADDFPCDETGKVTDVHIWGSWLNDINAGINGFNLRFWSNNPGQANGGFSHPEAMLWEGWIAPEGSPVMAKGHFKERLWEEVEYEKFWDPVTNQWGMDHLVVQYNMYIDPAVAFIQQGTETQEEIYWLEVQAYTNAMTNGQFGWKTRGLEDGHYMDDAVYWLQPVGMPGQWQRLEYETGGSIDMAFVITPEPATMALLGLGVAGLVARRRNKK